MRFLVDENLPVDAVDALRRNQHDALYVFESEHRGASDSTLWSLAAREGRVLITRDLDFPLPDSPKPVGLVLVRVPDAFRRAQIGRLVEDFIVSDAATGVEGTITVVSPGRVRTRAL